MVPLLRRRCGLHGVDRDPPMRNRWALLSPTFDLELPLPGHRNAPLTVDGSTERDSDDRPARGRGEYVRGDTRRVMQTARLPQGRRRHPAAGRSSPGNTPEGTNVRVLRRINICCNSSFLQLRASAALPSTRGLTSVHERARPMNGHPDGSWQNDREATNLGLLAPEDLSCNAWEPKPP